MFWVSFCYFGRLLCWRSEAYRRRIVIALNKARYGWKSVLLRKWEESDVWDAAVDMPAWNVWAEEGKAAVLADVEDHPW